MLHEGGPLVKLIETPAGPYTVRGGLMRRVPTEAERVARTEARAAVRVARMRVLEKFLEILRENRPAATILTSSLIGAAIGSADPTMPHKLLQPTFQFGPWSFSTGMSIGAEPRNPDGSLDKSAGAARGASAGLIYGTIAATLMEAIELQSVGLKASVL